MLASGSWIICDGDPHWMQNIVWLVAATTIKIASVAFSRPSLRIFASFGAPCLAKRRDPDINSDKGFGWLQAVT